VDKPLPEKKHFSLVSFLKKRYRGFSQTERFLSHVLFVISLSSLLFIFININKNFLIDTPRSGGTLSEGIVGIPRFINPLFAERDVDQDLTSLVYSGLTRRTPQGNLIPDLAESWEISEDGQQYTFRIADDASFHDGTPVTAEDVVFTITAIQDSLAKSPYERDWDGIVIEALDEKTVIFRLPKAFSPFIQNTTLGILPSHIWKDLGREDYLFSRYNLTPIGSGPYEVVSTNRSPSNINKYTLRSFKNYQLGRPLIDSVDILFFDTQENLERAYASGIISSGLFESSDDDDHIITFSETFALFFNQTKLPSLQDKDLRKGIYKIMKDSEIAENISTTTTETLNSFVPTKNTPKDHTPFSDVIDEDTEELIEEAGWTKGEDNIWKNKQSESLSFTISTADNPLLIEAGQHIVKVLKENGIVAKLEIFSSDDFLQQVIRPRNFEVLLFGQQINHGLDLYGFWHSSQRNDPGLNIAQYTNLDVNKELEGLRGPQTPEEYQEVLTNLLTVLEEDIPAIPLFSRNIHYTLPEDFFSTLPNLIVYPSERFNGIYQWHLEKDSLWGIFK